MTERGIARPAPVELTSDAIEEARGLVGVPLRRRPHYTLASREVLLRYAKAIGSRNPLYTDLSHGTLNTPWASLLGHPTVIFTFDSTVVAPKLAGVHSIYAGVSLQWYRQIRPGDRITAHAELVAVEEKSGRFCGPMVLQTGKVTYTNQQGAVVAIAQPRIMRTPRKAAREMGKYANLERHHYTRDDFERIMHAYATEQFRGDKPRFYEDVEIGEQLNPIVKGPLTTEDMTLFVSEVQETRFFGDFVRYIRRHPADVYWHPDTNVPDSWDSSLLLDAPARAFGFPCAHDTGLQRVAWFECLITNWIGDLAVLRKLDVRLTAPFLHADTAWLSGTVSAKGLTDDGRTNVDLNLRCENQRGEAVAIATAVVELPSKDFEVPQPGLVL